MRRIIGLSFVMMITLLSCNTASDAQKRTDKQARETTASTNNVGVAFLDISLEEAIIKAKESGKMIFISCSTTTCGPCKMMKKRVLSSKECGEYINKNFIALHKNFDEEENMEIGKKYSVMIYPTYLILNADGTKKGELLGAEKNIDTFIEKVKQIANS